MTLKQTIIHSVLFVNMYRKRIVFFFGHPTFGISTRYNLKPERVSLKP